jgi:hypothetical protein
LDITLEVVDHHSFVVKGNTPNCLRVYIFDFFFFFFHFFLEGISLGTVVTGILDMRPGKHDLHFLVGAELLPHAFVNIPDGKMHIGVILYLFLPFIIFFFIYILNFIYVYLFIVFLFN